MKKILVFIAFIAVALTGFTQSVTKIEKVTTAFDEDTTVHVFEEDAALFAKTVTAALRESYPSKVIIEDPLMVELNTGEFQVTRTAYIKPCPAEEAMIDLYYFSAMSSSNKLAKDIESTHGRSLAKMYGALNDIGKDLPSEYSYHSITRNAHTKTKYGEFKYMILSESILLVSAALK